jgi:N-acetylneuraminate synthase
MGQPFEIRGRQIGGDAPTFVIAEAGSNHNGSLELAHRLVDAAADAGVDAVKFQTFRAERLYTRSAGTSDYLKNDTPIFELIRSIEMPPEWLPELRDQAHGRGIAFLSTPFHEEAVELLDPYVDAFKIASYELTHEPLLREVARRGKPVLLSTGASDLDEARRAVDILRDTGCAELVVLQCTASYPTTPEAANVRALVTLREQLAVLSGLSDHTRDAEAAPMAAVALGASVIEKHFTLSNDLEGPDHAFAVEPQELARLVRGVRRVEAVLGTGAKSVHESEHELRTFARRSIFTTRPIQEGESFSRRNVDILRAGKLEAGLPPAALERVLRAAAARDIAAETPLSESDLADPRE